MVLEAFRKVDVTGDGKLTVEDLLRSYHVVNHPKFRIGEMTEEQVRNQLLAKYEGDSQEKSDGIVTKQEFLDFYTGVSASVDSDDYFELMLQNAF